MSKGADNIKTHLRTYMKQYRKVKVSYESTAVFSLRWDFLIHTKIPIAIEFDGIQHKQFSSFFHGTVESFNKSKSNDAQKNILHANGKVTLIRVEKEDLSYDEFCDLLEPFKIQIKEAQDDGARNKSTGTRNKLQKREIQREHRTPAPAFGICNGDGYFKKVYGDSDTEKK